MTIFDISAKNKPYALELADSAGVQIQYEWGDFIQIAKQHDNRYEHVVTEFHPLLKKGIDIDGDDIKLFGNYFSNDLETPETPYAAFLDDQTVSSCLVR